VSSVMREMQCGSGCLAKGLGPSLFIERNLILISSLLYTGQRYVLVLRNVKECI